MTSKNKVDVTVKGKDNRSVVVGGTIGRASSGDSENEVRVNINGENLTVTVAGADIIESALFELRELLTLSLEKKSDKEDVSEITTQLSVQANKPAEERNISKIKRLLNDLASYIGLAGFAITQAGKIKVLYEQVAGFFGI